MTDAGLEHLRSLKGLRALVIGDTRISEKATAALAVYLKGSLISSILH